MPHVSAYLELSLCFVPVYIFLSSNELFVLCSHICKWHALMSLHGILGPCTLFFCHTPSFTHRFVTHHLSQTTFTHTIFHTQICHIQHFLRRTPSFTYHFVTHNSSHTTCFTSRSSTTSFVFPSFPVPLQHLLLIIGRSWLVGLSGPLIPEKSWTLRVAPSKTGDYAVAIWHNHN